MPSASRLAPLFSSVRGDWETPPALFAALDAEFHFTLDATASSANTKCPSYYSIDHDSLRRPWVGTVWLNPPYGRGIGWWIAKAAEAPRLHGSTVVCLLPARTDTRWWHAHIWDGSTNTPRPGVEVRFLPGRVRFVGSTAGAPFPSAIVVFRPPA